MFIPDRSIFQLTLDALPDGVLLTDRDRRVVYTNQAFADLWGISTAVLESRDETEMLYFVRSRLVDPDCFLREVERIHPTNEASTDQLDFVDGRVISRRSVPFSEGGQFAARIWIFTDITEVQFARHDALTGLKNRRAYGDEFPSFANIDCVGWKTVALLDVDNFKSYNDIYGHSAGDEALRRIGEILRKQLSGAGDLSFRIGGEEFMMARRTNTEMEAISFFELVRQRVAGLNILHSGNPPHGVVTVSIGIYSFAGPRATDILFTDIDAALYRAKASGRNRIECASCSESIQLVTEQKARVNRRRYRTAH